MLKEIVISIQSFSEAHRFIEKNKLLKWIIIPGIIYTILFITGMYFFIQSSNDAVSWLSSQLRIEGWLQQERSAWLSYFFVMAGIMLRLILFLFYFSLFKYLVLIIGSPVFAYLSEKTESIIEGKDYSFNWIELRKDAYRGIKLALRNAVWQTVYTFLLLLLSLFPLIGWITPVIALFIECYYYGFSMFDYSFARNKFSPSQSIQFIGRHRGLAVGNGLLFYLLHVVIVFAPAYAIVAATLSVYKIKTT
ncbi:MAG: EI24 domain-containing protein [Chitinophagales bacterium]